MSHIDEGALHAYLDGALDAYPAAEATRIREHLESCAACAARLAGERAIREEADAILEMTAPVVQMPPLEDLRALAEHRTRTSRVRGLSRMNRWSWAASVVLALGTGWMLRGAIPGIISEDSVQEKAAQPSVATPVVDEVAGATAMDENRQQEEQARGTTTDPTAGAGSRGTVGGISAPSVPSAPETSSETARREEDDVVAGFAETSLPEAIEGAGVGALVPAAEEELAAAPSPPAGDPVLQDPSSIVDVLAKTRSDADRPDALRRERAAGEVAETPPAEAVQLESRAVGDRSKEPLFRSEQGGVALSVQPGSDPSSLVVPDLTVVDVASVEDAGVAGIVRVRQIMENGDTLEILHLPEGSDPSDLGRLPSDGRTELVAPHGDGWIVLRAHAEGDDLAEYLRALLGG